MTRGSDSFLHMFSLGLASKYCGILLRVQLEAHIWSGRKLVGAGMHTPMGQSKTTSRLHVCILEFIIMFVCHLLGCYCERNDAVFFNKLVRPMGASLQLLATV